MAVEAVEAVEARAVHPILDSAAHGPAEVPP